MTGGDGRNVDPRLGLLAGEGADQAVPPGRGEAEGAVPFEVWRGTPEAAGDADPTYYDRPLLKEPTWIWTVPAYFVAGGVAGAAAVLGAASQVAGGKELRGLVTKCRWLAAAGGAVGTAGLIVDLGRPERFLNMLRVFRPTSPMSVGSWVLAGAAPLASGSAILSRTSAPWRFLGDSAGLGAGVLGMPLAGYTATLLSNTAVPVWQASRRSLPPVFIASGVSSCAGLLQLLPLSERERRVVHRYAIAGNAADLVAHAALEREAGQVGRVGRVLHEGMAGALLRLSKGLSAASLLLNLTARRSRAREALAGLCATGSAISLKFGIFRAGKASAADPRASFHRQRATRD